MRLTRCWMLLTALVSMPSILAAAPLKEGRWTLRASGMPFLLLDLRKDAAGNGRWTGSLTRPKHFEGSSNLSEISNVEGPAVSEPIVETDEEQGALELTVRDSSRTATKLIWRPSEDGGGTLKYKGLPLPPLRLSSARTDERVPDVWDKAKLHSALPEWPDNAEMAQLFEADQADRQDPASIDWKLLGEQDRERRLRTKALLDAGGLRTGTDFYRAAFIFQHGDGAQDFLLAHSLAVIAAARGRPSATWIASATLDRYLQSIGQKQIYGTQFSTPTGKPATQEPYDRALVSDALRDALGVPPLAAQEEQRKRFEARRQP